MTYRSGSQLAAASVPPETIPESTKWAQQRQRPGGRALAIIAVAMIGPAAIAVGYFAALTEPIARFLIAPSEAWREGGEAAIRAATLALGADVGMVRGLAPMKSVGALCLTAADAATIPLPNVQHGPGAEESQSAPSIECLPPALALPGKPAVKLASLSSDPEASRPAALKEPPRLAPRQHHAPAAAGASPPAQVRLETPGAGAPSAAPPMSAKPVLIINKNAALTPPAGMSPPTFGVRSAAALPTVAAPAEQQLGVIGVGLNAPAGTPGVPAQKIGGKGKTQNADVKEGKRVPEQLPWLTAEGASRRNSLGRNFDSGKPEHVEVFGTAIPVGTPSWSENLYQGRLN
jgi:hypothetical protein